jgi:pimeloyl-ACP methyl ester carboxylesterase
MPDLTPGSARGSAGEAESPLRLSLGSNPLAASVGRSIRKDEIEIPERGLYLESWLPERRSRRRPLLFLHGELGGSWLWERYLGYFAGRGWEGHALNLRNHYWSQTADPAALSFDTYTDDVVAAIERLGPSVVVIGHGMGGLLALKAAERHQVGGLILLSCELPKELRGTGRPHEQREVPEVYGKSAIGWETLPDKVQRENGDLTLADILRIQHLLGQKPKESGAARRQMLAGVAVDRRALRGVPILVIGAGLDRQVPEAQSERLAAWLEAPYEPFGAHSHYGLVVGEQSHVQVAEAIRAFLEMNRL